MLTVKYINKKKRLSQKVQILLNLDFYNSPTSTNIT